MKLLYEYATRRTELYDLSHDPYEKNNIASQHPEQTADLLKRLREWGDALPREPSRNCLDPTHADGHGAKE
ncbi:MAG: hypothetical protein AB7E95_03015 [Kiritimatiellales bacterium]